MPVGDQLGKTLVVLGGLLILVGGLLLFGDKIPYIGGLPGDVHFNGRNFEFYFPVVTGLLISGLLTGLIWLFKWLTRG